MPEDTVLRGFVTKYALTTGIIECDARRSGDSPFVVVSIRHATAVMKLGSDFFESRDEAVAKAQEMARRKIESLQKQIAKLQKLAENPRFGGLKGAQ
jgi:hypothetical protein